MLILKDINLTIGRGSNLERKVLNNLNLQVNRGEFVIIIGCNGAGKTTIMNIISGYRQPDSGEIIIDGKNVTNYSQTQRSSLVAKVMQDPKVGTIPQMTIEENLSFAYMRGKKRGLVPYNRKNRKELFCHKLSILGIGLENRLHDYAADLSGGQRQALSLVMAIMADSSILLLDEITAALDPKVAESVMAITARLVKEENHATLMITHNMNHAIEYGHRTLLLAQGKIAKEFNVQEKTLLTPSIMTAEF
jgi:putative ABC transport system ATP-binding protein